MKLIIAGCMIGLLLFVIPFSTLAEITLAQLSVEETEAVSADLSQALKWYYEGDYARALSVFKQIPGQSENPDFLFWIGTSAARSGECDLAVGQLRKLLVRKPDHLIAQIELGITYYKCGQPEAAKSVFEDVLAMSPPPEVENVARSYLAKSEGVKVPGKIFDWRMRLSQGFQYDDNITSGPDRALIDDGAVPVRLDEGQKEQTGRIWISDLKINLYYDVGKSGGFYMDGGMDIYYAHSLEDKKYHYFNGGVSAGPAWAGKKDIVKMPVSYVYQNYGESSLSHSVSVSPNWEHFMNDHVSVKAGYRLESERFDEEKFKENGYDNESHQFSAGPKVYLKKGNVVISALYVHEVHDAESDAPSYDANQLSASVFAKFPTDTDLYFMYKWSGRDYEAPFTVYDHAREDERQTLFFVLSQNFLDHYFVAGEVVYIHNDSNADLYDFDKTAYTLKAGMKY